MTEIVNRENRTSAVHAVGDQGRLTAAGYRSAGALYQELLDGDSRPVPAVLRAESPLPPGVTRVPAERYTSKAFHDLEVERLWKRAWQMACREEELPGVGDYVVYDIAHLSFLVVRTAEHEIKAFHNACLHRGRQLREFDGRGAQEFRCPFHGWCWEIDGALKEVVCAWDFPDVTAEAYHLPEVRVGTWGGFVFINPDPSAEPLDVFLAGLDEQFARWDLGKKFKQAHVAKVLRCNWKVAQEAFMEAYHVVATHPQLLQGIGDSNSQYDVFGNFSRAITPNGTPSPHLKEQPSQQEMLDAMFDKQLDDEPMLRLPEGASARAMAAMASREGMRGLLGSGADEFCDAEYLDSMYYSVFPNFHPWGAFNRITYRFRPHGDNPDECIMECMFLSPWPEGEERPAPAPVHWIDVDDDWTAAPELGMLARVFNQDTFNIPKVQIGLKTMQRPEVVFASYNESKPLHFHQLLNRWLELE